MKSTFVTTFSSEELTKLIKTEIESVLTDSLTPKFEKSVYTQEEFEAMTGFSKRSQHHLRKTRQIDFIQHDRKILYPSDGVYSFFENHRIKAEVK